MDRWQSRVHVDAKGRRWYYTALATMLVWVAACLVALVTRSPLAVAAIFLLWCLLFGLDLWKGSRASARSRASEPGGEDSASV